VIYLLPCTVFRARIFPIFRLKYSQNHNIGPSSPSRQGSEDSVVYHSATVWPDAALGIFAPNDPRFSLPGNVGFGEASQTSAVSLPKQAMICLFMFSMPGDRDAIL
jgi:hypothetical protein